MASPPSTTASKVATSEVSALAALAQLDRILTSTHFRNSRRCKALLKYVVDTTAKGKLDALKERVVGAEVFGRDPDYDTNEDAVVRNAAAEVRKRLAQYYQEPGHESELRITLPAGSYHPEFHPPVATPMAAPAPEAKSRMRLLLLAGGLVALGVVAGLLLSAALGGKGLAARDTLTELDEFWVPTLAAPGEALIIIGQSRALYLPAPLSIAVTEGTLKGKIDVSLLRPARDLYSFFGDSFCLARLNGYLQSHGKASRFRGAAVTPYSEVRGQPVVLIGAFNNQWTQRLTEGLRFSLANDQPDVRGVRDSQNPGNLGWRVDISKTGWIAEEDYALITRVYDPRTERVVVATGGIGHYGTMSTGDFLTNPEYFRQALKSAPKDWAKRNLQIVLKVKVADGTPGPPEVLATHFW